MRTFHWQDILCSNYLPENVCFSEPFLFPASENALESAGKAIKAMPETLKVIQTLQLPYSASLPPS